MSSFVRWMSGVRVGAGVAVTVGAVQPTTIARSGAARTARKRKISSSRVPLAARYSAGVAAASCSARQPAGEAQNPS